MASVRFEGLDEYNAMLAKLGDSYDATAKRMLQAGIAVAKRALAAANSKFAKYLRVKSPKRNAYGWFAQVHFEGKTSSGAPAAKAVTVYEHGRAAGEKNGRKYPAQPARPWINKACAAVESEVVAAMQQVYDEEVAKIAGP